MKKLIVFILVIFTILGCGSGPSQFEKDKTTLNNFFTDFSIAIKIKDYITIESMSYNIPNDDRTYINGLTIEFIHYMFRDESLKNGLQGDNLSLFVLVHIEFADSTTRDFTQTLELQKINDRWKIDLSVWENEMKKLNI